MVSGLRTIARLMGTDLSAIPADPPGLRRRLEAVSPAAGGLSQGRWNNIRSLTLAALKHAGVQTMPGRSREPLLPPGRPCGQACRMPRSGMGCRAS